MRSADRFTDLRTAEAEQDTYAFGGRERQVIAGHLDQLDDSRGGQALAVQAVKHVAQLVAAHLAFESEDRARRHEPSPARFRARARVVLLDTVTDGFGSVDAVAGLVDVIRACPDVSLLIDNTVAQAAQQVDRAKNFERDVTS